MADKPKTYAQQVQELKLTIEQKDDELLDYRARVTLIPLLEAEVAKLREQVDKGPAEESATLKNYKLRIQDLESEVTGYAKRAREWTVEKQNLVSTIQQWEIQLEKSNAVAERMSTTESQLVELRQQYQDLFKEKQAVARNATEHIAFAEKNTEAMSKQIRQLTLDNQSMRKLLVEVRGVLDNAPDVLSQLRQVAGIG